MDRIEIETKVKEVFMEEFQVEGSAMVSEAHIFNDLGFDSLDMIDLVVALQSAFNVKIRDDVNVREIRTVEDIYTYIENIKNKIKA